MRHEHEHEHFCLHVGLKIAKLVLEAASVAAAFCTVKELHKLHRHFEEKKEEKKEEEKKHHKLL